MIKDISPEEAALLVPLNAVVQDLHARELPQLFRTDVDAAALAEQYRDALSGRAFALGWEEAGRLLGYGLFEVIERPETPLTHPFRRGYISEIAVHPEARRRGIALALIEAAKLRFAAAGCDQITAQYHAFNTASARLMQKAGLAPMVMTVGMWA